MENIDMSTPEYDKAAATVIPFGKHIGKTIDKIAETDDGLMYLDWARGAWTNKPDLLRALTAYLGDPAIKADLEKVIANRAADRAYAKQQWR
jgi:hypothetical protein